MLTYILIYISLLNMIGFVMVYADKKRSISKEWRIPEKILHTVSSLGGFVGTTVGMLQFRHKTKKISFIAVHAVASIVGVFVIYEMIQLTNMRF